MNEVVKAVLNAVLILGSMGLVFGVLLVVASRIFAIEQDPRIEQVREHLSGANCGGCGLPGCDAMAEAIVKGEAPVNACPSCNEEAVKKISEVMGVEAGKVEKKVAYLKCQGCDEVARKKYDYYGIKDCREQMIVGGGDKACASGCLGCGTCEKVCPFDAIHLGENGLPVVDKDKCKGCSVCVQQCPRNVLMLVPMKSYVHVACNNHEKGKAVKKQCDVGCIACGMCVKKCPFEAISIPEGSNLPVIDYTKCHNCGVCAEKCPQKSIINDLLK